MNVNQKQINIKNLLNDYSIETTPNVYEKYATERKNASPITIAIH